MMKKIATLFILVAYSICACAHPNKLSYYKENVQPVAFPGAEGFGKYTTGGRGGKVWVVTNLNNAGPGSFREAAEKKAKRIITFALSGTIHLDSKITIQGDVTIAGHTAPGDGICLADNPISIGGDNTIIRYMRFRMGDKYQNKGYIDGAGGDDAFGGSRRKNIIIDHCSMSWSTDEVCSIYAGDSTTIQWCILSEPLNYSYHFEAGDKDFEHHGYGGIWGGLHTTAHHNLFAHCNNRNPRFNGIRHTPTELVDYCNNVIYNWGSNTIYAGEGGDYNIVNNYFKYGPNTNKNVRFRIVNPGRNEKIGFGKWYVNGNMVDGAGDVSRNNWLGIDMGNNGTEAEKKQTVIDKPHPSTLIPIEKAAIAYDNVLQWAGASYKRDTLDARIIADVKNRTGKFIDVQGGYPHGTSYEATVNAWPTLKQAQAQADADSDGMPDVWEKNHGLNPKDAKDAASFTIDKSYTNIEVFINELVRN